MLVKNINKNIQETLKAKERALSRREISANQEKLPIDVPDFSDLSSRAVFTRMASNKFFGEGVVIQGGEINFENSNTDFNFDAYKNVRPAGEKAEGIRHISGIKDISVEYTGGYKAIRKATINWVVNSLDDLTQLTSHFLTVGKTVLLDWGWIYKRKELNQYKTFLDVSTETSSIVKQEVFTNPMPTIYAAKGNYDAIGGVISNFEYKLREDGGFDCVTYLTSVGVSIFESYSVDKGSTEFGLAVDNEKNVSQIRNDNLINGILNLPSILEYHLNGSVTPSVNRIGASQAANEDATNIRSSTQSSSEMTGNNAQSSRQE